MTVYVDDVRHSFGNMVMCHMWADSLDELFEMADHIGVKRKWLQGHPTLSFGKHRNASWVHFDIAISKKKLALAAGAVLTDKYGPVEHEAKQVIARGSTATVEQRARARGKLAAIKEIRSRDV